MGMEVGAAAAATPAPTPAALLIQSAPAPPPLKKPSKAELAAAAAVDEKASYGGGASSKASKGQKAKSWVKARVSGLADKAAKKKKALYGEISACFQADLRKRPEDIEVSWPLGMKMT